MNILVVRNNSNPQAVSLSLMAQAYLAAQGIESIIVDSVALGNDLDRARVRTKLPEQLDLVIVLGGDGTMLHTVHLVNGHGVPILPINFGRLGFLANGATDNILPLICDALAGDLSIEKRTMLSIEVVCASDGDPYEREYGRDNVACAQPDHIDPAKIPCDSRDDHFGVNRLGLAGARRFCALNEAAFTRGALGRIIELTLNISGSPVANMRGDGIVVSTATGSTGYALSAGGPLVSPAFDGMIAVPIAPHTLRARAIVTNASDVVEVTADDRELFREATLFIDGELMLFPEPIRKIYVRTAEDPVRILRAQSATFYERVSRDFFGE